MWVSPNARGQGVGSLLLKSIMAWSKDLNVDHISLAVTTTNELAVKLYKSYGFENVGSLEELRDGSVLSVQPMKLDLCSTAA
jgi:ribosomal protein S18 acetylase RimI-like enzyme